MRAVISWAAWQAPVIALAVVAMDGGSLSYLCVLLANLIGFQERVRALWVDALDRWRARP